MSKRDDPALDAATRIVPPLPWGRIVRIVALLVWYYLGWVIGDLG